jgi:glycosyltransferase involved in cell wall biosynthesis
MSEGVTAVFLVQRLGPYHHARLQAWAALRSGAVTVIEFRPTDAVYAWAAVEAPGRYARRATSSPKALIQALDEFAPQVVVCVGYADPEIHQAMVWALAKRVPLVTCSDSTFEDEPRSWFKEGLKRAVVTAFAAGLAAGQRAHAYLAHLGLDAARRFQPWDVVDNSYFARGADAARADAAVLRAKRGLPPRYFLSVARFVPKKNLARLIEAYALYAAAAGPAAWGLVLSGSGPLESALRAQVASAGLEGCVNFRGFLQYPELPACYGLAAAFVLPSESDQWGLVVNEAMAAGLPVLVSSRCGCAPDLVRTGENGFTFAPDDVAEIAARLTEIAGYDDARRAVMGRRSREIIAEFSPEAFAQGLEAAVGAALADAGKDKSWFSRILVSQLARRAAPTA